MLVSDHLNPRADGASRRQFNTERLSAPGERQRLTSAPDFKQSLEQQFLRSPLQSLPQRPWSKPCHPGPLS